ncbi:unnamed protein product [Aspergillus oryzae]|uniref:DNA, SC010 n=4 Tax=Aspergillus oryzae TaxID=5062 RepID=Q2TXN7_ASPOR|nr:unnamed protein product [Aspergillus oryzae RIB40]EIT82417.1 hypothetical protein Ao3042_00406 [Aspergillus oryzae 3.042]KDE82047.1 hypothetical protein AO1008_08516 [Aspergillus oryzae 100-8]GMF74772.1 unnamed protein product [Aspergillus oryzae]GMG47103.1 unnamed protein product [Aspergillus oryzae var. brunneus]BAE65986.1 unnamed protein product [Aspergillus oryzae RIB40]|eukprot:EIT82417.1 hypothetical protein Ao3042_00406 [Aspergillus oryzae 3.042]
MAETLPTSLSTALDISPSGDQFSMELPTDIAFGAGEFGLIHAFRVVKVKDLGYRTNKRTSPVSCGGYVASLMAKYAVVHASKHETLRTQTDVRTSLVQFYRPIIASKPVQMQLREVSLGKAWSTLRVETSQFGKIAASADLWWGTLVN